MLICLHSHSIYAQNIRTIQVILQHIILSYKIVFTTFHTYTVPWCAGIPSLHTACKAGASRWRKTYTIQTERNSSLGLSPQWFATQTPVQILTSHHPEHMDWQKQRVCMQEKKDKLEKEIFQSYLLTRDYISHNKFLTSLGIAVLRTVSVSEETLNSLFESTLPSTDTSTSCKSSPRSCKSFPGDISPLSIFCLTTLQVDTWLKYKESFGNWVS